MRTADVYLFGRPTGTLAEDDNGSFCFQYDAQYLQDPLAVAISSTMPLRNEAYVSDVLF
jgi:HipA-like protein